jgi:DNA modification methylase
MVGDCRERLRELPDASVNCCVTSPPYFGLRDYGHEGQMGLEPTPDEFVAGMVEVFREVKRVLRDDGTLWLNIGDTYNNNPSTSDIPRADQGNGSGAFSIPPEKHMLANRAKANKAQPLIERVIKKKDLIGIPWLLAFALRADGWYLRQDIIWSKPNPMPESVRDRCTKAHEYLFLLSKGPRYYYDAEAIAEPAIYGGDWAGSSFDNGKTAQHQLGRSQKSDRRAGNGRFTYNGKRQGGEGTGQEAFVAIKETRNKRSVWEVATQPFSEAHFATFPISLIEPCILAGCPKGGTVIDPFGGAGTTAMAASKHGRDAILVELNREYALMAERRLRRADLLFADIKILEAA